jgi:hypothetical protein
MCLSKLRKTAEETDRDFRYRDRSTSLLIGKQWQVVVYVNETAVLLPTRDIPYGTNSIR